MDVQDCLNVLCPEVSTSLWPYGMAATIADVESRYQFPYRHHRTVTLAEGGKWIPKTDSRMVTNKGISRRQILLNNSYKMG